jgi:hypothetical protein
VYEIKSNSVGILSVDTWRYYINLFGCLHFKGNGIEDNYYLFRPIWLNNGEQVVNKRTFLIAKEESNLVEGVDFIFSIHLDAGLAAKIKYHSYLISAKGTLHQQIKPSKSYYLSHLVWTSPSDYH